MPPVPKTEKASTQDQVTVVTHTHADYASAAALTAAVKNARYGS